MNEEYKSKHNNGIHTIIEKIYKLREIEYSNRPMDKKYILASKLISTITNELLNKNNFVLFRPIWDEIHDRMVYYYSYNNTVNLKKKMGLFKMTLHNEAIIWWLRYGKKLSGPLLHVDTHDDMSCPPSTIGLLKSNGQLDCDGIDNGNCAQISWPVTCLLLAKATDHVIWGIPEWTYDDDNSFNEVLVTTKKGDKTKYIRNIHENRDDFLAGDVYLVNDEEIEDISTYKFYHPIRFDRVKIFNLSGWRNLINIIDGNKFILDIDLDFFICNGEKNVSKKMYQKDFTDLRSYDRTMDGLSAITTPREMYTDDRSLQIIDELNLEIKILTNRLNIFLKGLLLLKNNGITPCCINLSDSCTSLFSGDINKATFTNEYTPKYFVPYIHKILINGFKKLYGNSFST